jgi:hypothetical protein
MLVRRMGRPSLLGTIDQAAVIAGTATATSKVIDRRLQQLSPEAADRELVARLSSLARLHTDGTLSDDEFESAKRRLLG